MSKKYKIIIIGSIVLSALTIQIVPVERTNPAVTDDFTTTTELKAIFQKSCYDCHSNETIWPWYSKVAPV